MQSAARATRGGVASWPLVDDCCAHLKLEVLGCAMPLAANAHVIALADCNDNKDNKSQRTRLATMAKAFNSRKNAIYGNS